MGRAYISAHIIVKSLAGRIFNALNHAPSIRQVTALEESETAAFGR